MAKPNGNGRITDKQEPAVAYASAADFGDVFLSNMNRLYLLAYLLTADHEMAERCFVEAIDHCINGNSVFKEWTPSWARRAIIKNAILMIAHELEGCGERLNKSPLLVVWRGERDHLLDHVAQLEPFERCVFVISVLERFSDYECSLLLRRTRMEIISGRRNAIKNLACSLRHTIGFGKLST